MSDRSHTTLSHRGTITFALLALGAVAACSPRIDVRTTAAPEASTIAGRRTFRVVEVSKQPNGNGNGYSNGYGMHDPMIENPITSKAIHDQIRAAFESRGYRYSSENADFELVYRATVAPILDIWSYFNYGYHGYFGHGGYAYPGVYGYPGYCCSYDGFGHAVGSYDRGSVIIDAVDPDTRKLLWRAQGTSNNYTEPKKFLKELRHAVNAIAKKFPAATHAARAVVAE